MFLFHFMPKTAGTTTTRAIRYAYNFNPNNFDENISNDGKYKFIPEERSNNISTNYKKNVILINKKNKNILITGHHAAQSCFYYKNILLFFLLRHPIERLISHYNVRKHLIKYSLEDIFIHKKLLDNPNNKKDLNYYSFHGNIPWMKNFYCQSLSGATTLKENIITNKTCDKIINGLKNGEIELENDNKVIKVPIVFGITESHKNTLNLFSKAANWNINVDNFYKEIAKNHDRRYADFVKTANLKPSNALISAIEKYNEFDIKLYNEAVKIFKTQFEKYKAPYSQNEFLCKYTNTKLSF